MQCVQALEVDVGAVHDVSGACFRDQQVEHVDVVDGSKLYTGRLHGGGIVGQRVEVAALIASAPQMVSY